MPGIEKNITNALKTADKGCVKNTFFTFQRTKPAQYVTVNGASTLTRT